MRTLIIILLLCGQTNIWACECVHYESKELSNLDYEIEHNNWIGIGTVVKVHQELYPVIYEIKVQTIYKGSKNITKIQTGLGRGDCGFVFELNQEYIIYGIETEEKVIETSQCSRTNRIDNSIDHDYLNKKFKNSQLILDWSESLTTFIQKKINHKINITQPPIIINGDYEILSITKLISKHPNYYNLEKINFRSKDLKKMNPKLREKVLSNGIIIVKSFNSKIRKNKLIKELNTQLT